MPHAGDAVDVVARTTAGVLTQTVWRFDGPQDSAVFATRARLLPGVDGIGTGYAAVGDVAEGIFTLTWEQLAAPSDASCPARGEVVRVDPATGRQSIVARLPRDVEGPAYGCLGYYLRSGQASLVGDHLYLLDGTTPGRELDRIYELTVTPPDP